MYTQWHRKKRNSPNVNSMAAFVSISGAPASIKESTAIKGIVYDSGGFSNTSVDFFPTFGDVGVINNSINGVIGFPPLKCVFTRLSR